MLEKITDPIFAPFRLLRSKIFQVKQLPSTVKGEIGRVKNEVGQLKGEAGGYAKTAKKAGTSAQQKGQAAAQKAGSVKAPKPQKKGFGLFGKKVACESCGQKLHPSWDECPYCGAKKGAAQAAAAGGAAAAVAAPATPGPQRTMALDLGSSGVTGIGLGWLIPIEGPRVGDLIELRGRVTVGKSKDNQVVIEDPSISGHHCEIVGSAAGFKLNDLGSTNGTFVNDKRIQSHDLVDNDNVTLGRLRLKFKSLN